MPDYVIPPAGLSAASFFTPTPFVDPSRPPAILADKLVPETGEIKTLFVGEDPVDAAIAHQFRVQRGSGAAVMEDGQDFASIKKNDDTAALQIQFETERILRPFAERGDITLSQVVVQAGEDQGDLGAVYVEYINNRTGAKRQQFASGANTAAR